MEIFNAIFLFLFGFFILVRGAQILVKGAVSVAKIFNFSPWFIGVVIVGVGTSIPEFSINLVAAFEGNAVGIGTIIGSNTFNILMILGVSALFFPIVMKKSWIQDFFVNAIFVAIAGSMLAFPVLGDPTVVGITRSEAGILFLLFILWLVFMFRRGDTKDETTDHKVFTVFTSFVMIVAGVVGVFFGGSWVVSGVEQFAIFAGISSEVIALTVIGAGTSIPELTVSVVAALRKNTGIAVGNVLGSNIFDFLGILGITGLIHPIIVSESVRFDIGATFIATMLLLAVIVLGRSHRIGRTEGLVLITAYVLYLILFIFRG
ncbi:hypothetical protein COU15_02305 [Candidatus Kaiserbacteria bacterium CG10_big_fil_rev_8_21_14_0_10_45_20]|uniref:Sodium/calcium exchanger membrane region domain-containing protein n=1 Tax=Candidatus Kaiserbacteria bacterium CG10_big_fil_rev_8_21_14_0_10_45_20 TaxID=1974607 RepID=A0A2H0UFL6_9BACT|nr:MAG: hypothetical protein COU15_02305 [Candidatus Kaiserbacteria bacterium CG10_big_fil_rev_8_21_14_0_10_45_20]